MRYYVVQAKVAITCSCNFTRAFKIRIAGASSLRLLISLLAGNDYAQANFGVGQLRSRDRPSFFDGVPVTVMLVVK